MVFKSTKLGYNINNITIESLAFADDLVILSDDFYKIKKLLDLHENIILIETEAFNESKKIGIDVMNYE